MKPTCRDFGGVSRFCGQVETIKCFENNPLVRQRLTKEDGKGKVGKQAPQVDVPTCYMFIHTRDSSRRPKMGADFGIAEGTATEDGVGA